jgi:hypothetical protein
MTTASATTAAAAAAGASQRAHVDPLGPRRARKTSSGGTLSGATVPAAARVADLTVPRLIRIEAAISASSRSR